MDTQLTLRSPYLFLSLLTLLILLPSSCRSDPDPLQDFCVAQPQANNIVVNGFTCKAASDVVSEDFFFDGLAKEGNTSNLFGSNVTAGSVLTFPGLNTLGLSMNRVDYAVSGLNPPHTHPHATELVLVLKGRVLVGFVTTSNVFFSKVVKAGENFVIPRGLMHFQYNVGEGKALAVTAFDSQLPGVVVAPLSLFGSKPSIPNEVLAKAFQVDEKVVNSIKSKFGGS